MEFREMTGKFGFIFARDGNVGAIEVGQFTRREWQGRDGGDGAGDPTEAVFFLSDFAGGIGGGPGVFGRVEFPVLLLTGGRGKLSDVAAPFFDFSAGAP